jgi:putrescine aminotransferase
MWGCQSVGSTPDLITFAKGVTSGYIPLGGVLVGSRVAKILIEKGGAFNHGYTYSGHPVGCAVAIASIRLIRELDIVRKVREELAPRLAWYFGELQAHPLVGEAETFGLMAALHLLKNKATGETFPADQEIGLLCRGICFDNGIVMRAVGDRMVVAPPLVMTIGQIGELATLIRRGLDLTYEQARTRGWLGA